VIEHIYAWLPELPLFFWIKTLLCSLHLCHNGIEPCRISNSNFTEHFSIKAYIGLFAAINELAVAQPTLFAGSIQAYDP